MLVPWDHIRVPWYPIRDPRVPIFLKMFLSSIIYCLVRVNWKFCPKKSKASEFLVAGSPFCSSNYLKIAKNSQSFFPVSISFWYRYYNKIVKKPKMTKRRGHQNRISLCVAFWTEGENRAGESSCVLYIRQIGPNSDHIFGPSSGTLGPITKKINLVNLPIMAGFRSNFELPNIKTVGGVH